MLSASPALGEMFATSVGISNGARIWLSTRAP